MPRTANVRGVRIHRSYTVAEAARTCGVARQTVRQWIRNGLPKIKNGRGFLIRGHDLKAFHEDRRRARKRPLKPGELYCLPCRAPRRPKGERVTYRASARGAGTLSGACPDCGRAIHRKVSRSKVAQATAGLTVRTMPSEADTHPKGTALPPSEPAPNTER